LKKNEQFGMIWGLRRLLEVAPGFCPNFTVPKEVLPVTFKRDPNLTHEETGLYPNQCEVS